MRTAIPVRTPSTKLVRRRLAADDTPLSRRIRTLRPSMGSTPRPNHLDSSNGDPIPVQEKHRRSQRTIHTPKDRLRRDASTSQSTEREHVKKPCNCVRWYKQGIKSTCTTRAMRIQYYMLHMSIACQQLLHHDRPCSCVGMIACVSESESPSMCTRILLLMPPRRPRVTEPTSPLSHLRTSQISCASTTPYHAELCGARAFCAGVGGTVPFSDNTVPRSSSFLRWSSACPPLSSSTVGCGRVLFFCTGVSGVESDGDSATGLGSLFGSSIRVISRTNDVPQYAAEYLFTYCVNERKYQFMVTPTVLEASKRTLNSLRWFSARVSASIVTASKIASATCCESQGLTTILPFKLWAAPANSEEL